MKKRARCVIYLNNVAFCYGWNNNATERFRPSDSMVVGTTLSWDNEFPSSPSSALVEGDGGQTEGNPALIYLNNVGFHFGWSSISEDRYRPSLTMEIGQLTSLNSNGLKVPLSWSVGIDDIAPMILTTSREPAGNPSPDQNVTIAAEVIDNESGVADVILSYTLNNTQTINITMNKVSSVLFQASIPAQPMGTHVFFNVTAYDNWGLYSVTAGNPYNVYNYVVIPEIPTSILVLVFAFFVVILALKKGAVHHIPRIAWQTL